MYSFRSDFEVLAIESASCSRRTPIRSLGPAPSTGSLLFCLGKLAGELCRLTHGLWLSPLLTSLLHAGHFALLALRLLQSPRTQNGPEPVPRLVAMRSVYPLLAKDRWLSRCVDYLGAVPAMLESAVANSPGTSASIFRFQVLTGIPELRQIPRSIGTAIVPFPEWANGLNCSAHLTTPSS